MSFIPQITCRHCGKKYSAIHSRCPSCGARRVKQSSRSASSTASVRPGSAANARAASNAKWQFIFGCVLTVAFIIAVIILINASLGTSGKPAETTPIPTDTVAPTPTPTPVPTPTPTPTPTVTSITITFLGSAITNNEFTLPIGTNIDLDASIYPVETEATVSWRSTDESICTVDSDGVVTPVSAGWGSVIAECGGVAAEVRVLVR